MDFIKLAGRVASTALELRADRVHGVAHGVRGVAYGDHGVAQGVDGRIHQSGQRKSPPWFLKVRTLWGAGRFLGTVSRGIHLIIAVQDT